MPDHQETAGPSSFFHQWLVCLSSPSSPLPFPELLLLLLHSATSVRGPTRTPTLAVRVLACRSPTCGAQCCRHAGFGSVQINTVITSGPPVSGQYLNVLVSGYTPNEIVVSRPSQCGEWRWFTTEFRPTRSPRSPSLKTSLIRCGAQPSTFAARKSTIFSVASDADDEHGLNRSSGLAILVPYRQVTSRSRTVRGFLRRPHPVSPPNVPRLDLDSRLRR